MSFNVLIYKIIYKSHEKILYAFNTTLKQIIDLTQETGKFLFLFGPNTNVEELQYFELETIYETNDSFMEKVEHYRKKKDVIC